jgi:hypothetical protein
VGAPSGHPLEGARTVRDLVAGMGEVVARPRATSGA